MTDIARILGVKDGWIYSRFTKEQTAILDEAAREKTPIDQLSPQARQIREYLSKLYDELDLGSLGRSTGGAQSILFSLELKYGIPRKSVGSKRSNLRSITPLLVFLPICSIISDLPMPGGPHSITGLFALIQASTSAITSLGLTVLVSVVVVFTILSLSV